MAPVVGFVGLGTMGAPMCSRLAAAGHDVIVHDLDPGRVADSVAAGARPGESVARCAAEADIMFTSLPEPPHVEAVMVDGGALAALRPGSLWIDLTTNRKELIERLAATAPTGVDVVDAPVTGAVDGARTGRLTVFVGGEPPAVARATPLLAELGRRARARTPRRVARLTS